MYAQTKNKIIAEITTTAVKAKADRTREFEKDTTWRFHQQNNWRSS